MTRGRGRPARIPAKTVNEIAIAARKETQAEVAKKFGVSQSYVSRIKNRRRRKVRVQDAS